MAVGFSLLKKGWEISLFCSKWRPWLRADGRESWVLLAKSCPCFYVGGAGSEAAVALHTAQPEGCLPGTLLSELQAQTRAIPQ